jgi:signal transduction histidine kinase
MRRPPSRSLRIQLVVLSAAATLVVLSGAAAVAVWQIHRVTDRALTDAMNTRVAALLPAVAADGSLGTRAAASGRATFVQVLGPRGDVVSASPSLVGLPPLMSLRDARAGDTRPRELGLPRPDVDLAVVGRPLQVRGGPGALVVGVESQGFLDARQQLTLLILVGLPIAVVLSGGLAWLLTGRALRSVVRLAEEADAISAGEPGRQLTALTRDAEVVRLVTALNRMLSRLDRRFAQNLAAAAETTHRLRTPLATLRADAELALADDDPEAARGSLARIIEDADRLSRLIDVLLSAARNQPERSDLVEQWPVLVEQWRRQAALRGSEIEFTSSGGGLVDVAAMRACVEPLVENALQHGTGPVAVTARAAADLEVRVENPGPGIPEQLGDRIFEPWVGTTNTGLGLWLARESARSAGGDVRCVAPGPPVTVFEVRLPLLPQRTSAATPGARLEPGLGSNHE